MATPSADPLRRPSSCPSRGTDAVDRPRRGRPRSRHRAIALRCLLGYLVGAIQLEHLGPLTGAGTAAMAALPQAQFPRQPRYGSSDS